ncbi:MAG: ATP-binding protein [Candidatus Njordarchaeia archaeon]
MDIRSYLVTKKEDIRQISVKPREKEAPPNVHFIQSIIGPRRAGKTFYLYYLIKKLGLKDSEYLFVNFEEEIEIEKISDLPHIHQEIYGVQPKYIFLDEIHAQKNWEKGVYTLYEKKRYNIYVTGSSSKLLAYELASKLRGRTIPVNIYPFSMGEILKINNIDKVDPLNQYQVNKVMNILRTRLFDGFFPDVVLGNIDAKQFYTNYIDLVIYKDIIERFEIKNRYALEYLIKTALASNAKNHSINKIYNTLKSKGTKISKSTLYNFQKILQDINLFIYLHKYDPSIKKIEQSTPKVYAIDTGLAHHNASDQTITKLLEQYVLLELIKKGYKPNKNIYYWKTPQGHEVDFIIQKNNKTQELIQVTYANNRDEIEKREIRALVKAAKTLKCKNLTIITWNHQETIKTNNTTIKTKPAWKWTTEKKKEKRKN